MLSLCHLPTIQIMSVLTLSVIMVIYPPVHIDLVLKSSVLNPFFGTVILTGSCKALIISVLCTEDHQLLWYTPESVVWLASL